VCSSDLKENFVWDIQRILKLSSSANAQNLSTDDEYKNIIKNEAQDAKLLKTLGVHKSVSFEITCTKADNEIEKELTRKNTRGRFHDSIMAISEERESVEFRELIHEHDESEDEIFDDEPWTFRPEVIPTVNPTAGPRFTNPFSVAASTKKSAKGGIVPPMPIADEVRPDRWMPKSMDEAIKIADNAIHFIKKHKQEKRFEEVDIRELIISYCILKMEYFDKMNKLPKIIIRNKLNPLKIDVFFMDFKKIDKNSIIIDGIRFVNYYTILKAKYEYCLNSLTSDEDFNKHLEDLIQSNFAKPIKGINYPEDIDFLVNSREKIVELNKEKAIEKEKYLSVLAETMNRLKEQMSSPIYYSSPAVTNTDTNPPMYFTPQPGYIMPDGWIVPQEIT
jgi:hypothetical protein